MVGSVTLPPGTPLWTLLAGTAASPADRFGQAMAYDPTRDRVLLFGGTDGRVPFADLRAISRTGRLHLDAAVSGGPGHR